ncbi:hypothetical protein V7S76_07705 [Aquirufa sp. ROCK2-A2]
MKVENQKLTSHTLHRVRKLGLFLMDRNVFTRLDIMALKMDCSVRQVRRYLFMLQENLGIHLIQKPQGFKLAADRVEVLNKLGITKVNFEFPNSLIVNQIMLNQG